MIAREERIDVSIAIGRSREDQVVVVFTDPNGVRRVALPRFGWEVEELFRRMNADGFIDSIIRHPEFVRQPWDRRIVVEFRHECQTSWSVVRTLNPKATS